MSVVEDRKQIPNHPVAILSLDTSHILTSSGNRILEAVGPSLDEAREARVIIG